MVILPDALGNQRLQAPVQEAVQAKGQSEWWISFLVTPLCGQALPGGTGHHHSGLCCVSRQWEMRSPGSANPLYLTVADGGVSEGIGSQHPPEGSDPELILEGGVLGHRAVEISLYLLRGQTILPCGLLYQVGVVAGVSHHLIPGPCGDTAGSCLSSSPPFGTLGTVKGQAGDVREVGPSGLGGGVRQRFLGDCSWKGSPTKV